MVNTPNNIAKTCARAHYTVVLYIRILEQQQQQQQYYCYRVRIIIITDVAAVSSYVQ